MSLRRVLAFANACSTRRCRSRDAKPSTWSLGLLTIDGPLRRDVVHYLRHISGMSYGLETEAWESWWSAEKHRFRFVGVRRWAPPTASELAEVLQDPSLTRYYQFDIYAKRVIFVIDRSSSMGTWARYGTRLDEAKRELIGAITALPQHVSFNMIFLTLVCQRGKQSSFLPRSPIRSAPYDSFRK